MDALTGLMLEPNKGIVSRVTSVIKKEKLSKKESVARNLKSNIVTSNEELREAYSGWIDSVIARQGWMSKEAVIEGQRLIDEFTARDLDIALEVLKVASIGGYRDMNWAINDYKRRPRMAPINTTPNAKVAPQLSDEVF